MKKILVATLLAIFFGAFFEANAASAPDLAIFDLKIEPSSPIVNEKANISFNVKNVGGALTATPTIGIGYPPELNLVSTNSECPGFPPGLTVGQSCIVRYVVTYSKAGSQVILANASTEGDANGINNAAALQIQVRSSAGEVVPNTVSTEPIPSKPPFVGIGSPNGDIYKVYDAIKVRLILEGYSPTAPVDLILYLQNGSGSVKHKLFSLSGSSLFNQSTYETSTAPIPPSIPAGDDYFILAEITESGSGKSIASGKNSVAFSVQAPPRAPSVSVLSPKGGSFKTYDSINVRLALDGYVQNTPVDLTLYIANTSGSLKHKIFNLSGSSLFNNSTYETGTAPIPPSIAQGDNYYVVAEVTDHTTGAFITSGKNTVPFSIITYSPVPSVAPTSTLQKSSVPKIDTANTVPVLSKPTDAAAVPKKTIESSKGNSGTEMKPQLKNDTKQQILTEKPAEGKKEVVTAEVKTPSKAVKIEQKKSENKIKSFFRRLFGRDR